MMLPNDFISYQNNVPVNLNNVISFFRNDKKSIRFYYNVYVGVGGGYRYSDWFFSCTGERDSVFNKILKMKVCELSVDSSMDINASRSTSYGTHIGKSKPIPIKMTIFEKGLNSVDSET